MIFARLLPAFSRDIINIYMSLIYVFVCDCVLSLEVTLQKRSEGPMWQELVLGDRRGEYVMSDEQAALIHERLTHLTSEDLVRPCSLHYTNNSTNKRLLSLPLIS